MKRDQVDGRQTPEEEAMVDVADYMNGHDVFTLQVNDFVACPNTTARAMVVSMRRPRGEDEELVLVRFIENDEDGTELFGKTASVWASKLRRLHVDDVIVKHDEGWEYGPCQRCGKWHELLTVQGGSVKKGYTKVCTSCRGFLGTGAE